jgi:hypothetical protein
MRPERPVSSDSCRGDLPDFFGPFRHWKVASGFAAMPQDFLNAAGVCCPKLECAKGSYCTTGQLPRRDAIKRDRHFEPTTEKENAVTRPFLLALAFLLLASPVLAEDFQTIGLIEAEFDGETLSQTTMSYLDEGRRLATASLTTVMGATSLTIQGAEGKPITIEALFTNTEPDPRSNLIGLSVGYFPSGMRSSWTSEGAPEPAQITFERLDTAADNLHASGTFAALLCFVPEGADEADTENCQPIAGRFETGLIRE